MDSVSHGAPAGAHPERLSFRFFVHELQHYLHLEKGLLHTFVDLLVRPGSLLRGYFDGTRRREYTNPIAYGLMAAAASLIAFSTYQKAYVSWMRGQIATMTPAGMPDGFFQAYMENVFAATQRTAVTSFLLGGTVVNVLKLLLAVGVSAFVGYMVIVVGVATYTVATMH